MCKLWYHLNKIKVNATDDCMENYCEDEDEDIYLVPISNSPRMGVCGYEGANDVYELD